MRLIVLLAIMGVGGSACTEHSGALPAGFQLDGRSASELSAEWWQWAQSIPAALNPVRDTSGAHCAVGQTGDVWFLAGGYGSSKISRTCSIPYGKYIFFPAVNMAYWPTQQDNGFTCDQAKRNAAVNNDSALNLFVEIDGIEVDNPREYRARTDECFEMYARVPAAYRPYRAFPSASDGYWYLLEPPKRGKHRIHFGGSYDSSGRDFGKMVQDIEYLISVE